jgi:hypothetical protein
MPDNFRNCPIGLSRDIQFPPVASRSIGQGTVAERQRSQHFGPSYSQRPFEAIFSHEVQALFVTPLVGGRCARDDKTTTQTTNRRCIFGGLSRRHRNRRNRYNVSSKARINSAVTLAGGAPALALLSGVKADIRHGRLHSCAIIDAIIRVTGNS